MAACHVGLGDRVVAVIGAHVAVDGQKPHDMPAPSNAKACEFRAELLGTVVRREAGELAPQRLHFRRSVEPEESAESRWVSFLEMLTPTLPSAERRHPALGRPRIHGERLKLGSKVSHATVARFLPWRPKVPSPTGRSFQHTPLTDLAAIDMFVVATATFRLLYALIVLRHD